MSYPAMVALTLLIGVAAATVGAQLLLFVGRRSLRYPLLIVTGVPVLAAVATVAIEARLGMLLRQDVTVVLVALAASLAVAGALACLLARTITAASAEVGTRVRQLAGDDALPRATSATGGPVGASLLPGELARVAADVAVTKSDLARALVRERTADQSRQELVSFLSHDLRTPLAGLRALAEGLEDGVIADLPRALGHLSSTVERMSGLVDDLFALSRVQESPAPKPQLLVSLAEVITDVATELASTAATRQVEIEVEVPAGDRLAVLGAPEDLSRALMNLVANAIRHTDPGQTVRLSGHRAEQGGVRIAVLDACGGIPDENLPHVFDTGWRGSPSPVGERGGGAGLGLAIARGVVQSHDGEIAVRNVGDGCLFQVDLPSSERAALSRRERSPYPLTSSSSVELMSS